MQITQTQKILIGVVVLVLLAGGYMLIDRKSHNTLGKTATTTEEISTKTSNIAVSGTLKPGQYKIERVDISNNAKPSIPNLSRQIVFSDNVSLNADQKSMVTAKIQSIQSDLKKNNNDLLGWINLGNYYKMIGDYKGALEAWKYEGDISNDFIAYLNMGDVYAYYMHDNGLAEVYYRKAIDRAPTKPTVYIQLGEMYRDVFQDKDKALAVINEGLSKIPNDPALLDFKSKMSK